MHNYGCHWCWFCIVLLIVYVGEKTEGQNLVIKRNEGSVYAVLWGFYKSLMTSNNNWVAVN